MSSNANHYVSHNLTLDKWFLDCVSETGNVSIFYIALLRWKGIEVPYTSWINLDENGQVTVRSRFKKIAPPNLSEESISWSDSKHGIRGVWKPLASQIETRVYDSPEGGLDWVCHQPVSLCDLVINGSIRNGIGYVERLNLTIEPWKIPMKQLRWGRFGSPDHSMVWIYLAGENPRKWLWYNTELFDDVEITDSQIKIAARGLSLDFSKTQTLESEKKLFNTIKSLTRFLPGFKKIVPLNFLMADESKWLSHGILSKAGEMVTTGWVIHELVDFEPKN